MQLPLNLLDAQFASFEQKVLPLLGARGIGVLVMKPLAAGRLLATGAVSGVEALHYVMNLPVDTIITGMESPDDLSQALQAATTFAPLSQAEVERLLRRAAPFAGAGKFEGYKTTRRYDGTFWHPRWLKQARV